MLFDTRHYSLVYSNLLNEDNISFLGKSILAEFEMRFCPGDLNHFFLLISACFGLRPPFVSNQM